jgi:hypothetical protein
MGGPGSDGRSRAIKILHQSEEDAYRLGWLKDEIGFSI